MDMIAPHRVSAPELAENEEALGLYRDAVRRFFDRHATEADVARWRAEGVVAGLFWGAGGVGGLLARPGP